MASNPRTESGAVSFRRAQRAGSKNGGLRIGSSGHREWVWAGAVGDGVVSVSSERAEMSCGEPGVKAEGRRNGLDSKRRVGWLNTKKKRQCLN